MVKDILKGEMTISLMRVALANLALWRLRDEMVGVP